MIRKIVALVLLVVLIGSVIAIAQAACNIVSQDVVPKAHWHSNIFGTRWPCVEGSHKAVSDGDGNGHKFWVVVEIYKDGSYLKRNSGTKSTSTSIEVSSASGYASAKGWGDCNSCGKKLDTITRKDAVW